MRGYFALFTETGKINKTLRISCSNDILALLAKNKQMAISPAIYRQKSHFSTISKVRNADFAKKSKSVQAKGSKTIDIQGKVL